MVQHRFLFQLNDETRLVYVLLKLPKNWLLDWGSSLIQIQPPTENDEILMKHYLFVLQVGICSYNLERVETPPSETEIENSDDDEPKKG